MALAIVTFTHPRDNRLLCSVASTRDRHCAESPGRFTHFGDRRSQAHVVVVAMEVLDNLSHDRVERSETGAWHETWAKEAEPGAWQQELRPLEDSTIAECLEAFDWPTSGGAGAARPVSLDFVDCAPTPAPGRRRSQATDDAPARRRLRAGPTPSGESFWSTLLDRIAGVEPSGSVAARPGDGGAIFLPTGCLQLFRAMRASLRSHQLIAGDFSRFAPGDVRVAGINAPIIAGKVRRRARSRWQAPRSSGRGGAAAASPMHRVAPLLWRR